MPEVSRAELKYQIERQREEIKTLNEVGRLLRATTDPIAIARLTASYLHTTFPVALCGILILPSRRLYLFPFTRLAQVEVDDATRQMREAAGQLAKRLLTDEETVVQMDPAPGTWGSPTTLRSHVFVSLMVKDQPLGVLGLFSGQPDAFRDEGRHAVGIVADQLGTALRNAFLLEELRRADELKNQLLSIVSHELSTPLTAIKEGVSLVSEGALGQTTPEQLDFLKTVMENANRLERLIQKIKTTTELMTGQTRFTFESYDLRTILASIAKTYADLAELQGVHLKVVEYPKPLFWQTDKVNTTQAISQLVENAIQATAKDGYVTVKLLASPLETEIQVIDTGVGIPKEAVPTLFEQFKSIGSIHDRKMGGLGLGLFVAKSLIYRQGGTITVESTPGQGTQMSVRLPKQPVVRPFSG